MRDLVTRLVRAWGAVGLYAYVFLWTVVAVVAATTTFIAVGSSSPVRWFLFLYHMLVYFYAWGAIALAIHGLTAALPLHRHAHVTVAAVHFGLLVAITASLPFVLHPLAWPKWLYGSHAFGFHALNAMIYSFVLIGSQLARVYRRGQAQERDAAAVELQQARLMHDLSQARVEVLRNQINPHFLFNTLNAVAALIETRRNAEAARVTGLLGSLLRTALYDSNHAFLELQRELDFVRRYVEIEKIRFGDRLQFRLDVDDGCSTVLVPSLFLQPIVENSIKYAVSPASAPVTIHIRARRRRDGLAIAVDDDGPGLEAGANARGIGLRNVRERLTLLYGNQASMDVRDAQPGVSVQLRLPVEMTPFAPSRSSS